MTIDEAATFFDLLNLCPAICDYFDRCMNSMDHNITGQRHASPNCNIQSVLQPVLLTGRDREQRRFEGRRDLDYSAPRVWWCHDHDRTYPYSPYPNLSTPIPSHLNHSQAPNAKSEPSDPLVSQQCTPKHSDSLAPSRRIPNPMLLQPFLSLSSSQFLTPTLIPDPTPFDLHSFASSLFLTSHWSCDCGQAKPNRIPPSLDAS